MLDMISMLIMTIQYLILNVVYIYISDSVPNTKNTLLKEGLLILAANKNSIFYCKNAEF